MTKTAAATVSRGRFAAAPDPAAVAAAWRARGYSCHSFDDPPGQAWNDFVHETNELVTVVDGRLELIVEQERFVVEPGDEAFIPRHACHSVRNLSEGRTHWLFGYD